MTKFVIVILISSIVLMFLAKSIAGCSCMPTHPQSSYCDSEYVIIARVLRKSVRRINNQDVYKIEIKKGYKMSDKANFHLKDGRLMTASSDSMCGVDLKVGKLYLIAGRDAHIGLCNYVKEYSKMSIVERRGFAGGYKKGCLCDIKATFKNYDKYKPVGTCIWQVFSKCETTFGACVPSRGIMTPEGKPVKCHWRNSQPYNACIDDNEP